ncbi:site-specific integrase [uncultured Phocaeicola sp.]|jgi:integrase|uniref:site-specific integrase n=2 Tax=uncultured Phocaeicola sp. TaxID=990718 RepID=UPI00256F030C|nr:site-specific integrase [Bacteroides intestinalis]
MSETIKVLCYKLKTLSNGEHPLMVCVCKDGKRKYQSLGISIKAEQWDFKSNLPKTKCPNRDRIILLINERINEIQKAALDKRIAGKNFTATTLIESTTNNTINKTVGEYYLTYIQNLKKENRIRYTGMFEVSYSSFIKFNKHLDIPFSDIDATWLKRYELWMKEQNLSVSTISTRIRHLRAVFNLAIAEHSIKNDCYPFHSYKVSKLYKQTAKRAISKKEVLKIMQYQGDTPMECLAIDVFVFSYLNAGINFIDIAKLKRSNIVESQLIYNREKTKKLINVPLQQKAMEIIAKYENDKSPYLFPILTPFHKTEIQIANRLHKVLAKINKHLKEIGKKLKLPIPLTTYVARHSYATVLKRAGVSTSIISESLGHGSEKITQVYLDSFDNSQINDAMKNLL